MSKMIKVLVSRVALTGLAISVLAGSAWGGHSLVYWMTGFEPDNPTVAVDSPTTSEKADRQVSQTAPPVLANKNHVRQKAKTVPTKPLAFGPSNNNKVKLSSFGPLNVPRKLKVAKSSRIGVVDRTVPITKPIRIAQPPQSFNVQHTGGFQGSGTFQPRATESSQSQNPSSGFGPPQLPQRSSFAPRTNNQASFGSTNNGFGMTGFSKPLQTAQGSTREKEEIDPRKKWAIQTRQGEVVVADLKDSIEWKVETRFGVVTIKSDDLLSMVVQDEVKPAEAKTTTSSPVKPLELEDGVPDFDAPSRPMPDDDVTFEPQIIQAASQPDSELPMAISVLDEFKTFVRQLKSKTESLQEPDEQELVKHDSDQEKVEVTDKSESKLAENDAAGPESNHHDSEQEGDANNESDKETQSPVVDAVVSEEVGSQGKPYNVLIATKSGEIFQGVCHLEPISVEFSWGDATVEPAAIGWLSNYRYGTYRIERANRGTASTLMLQQVQLHQKRLHVTR